MTASPAEPPDDEAGTSIELFSGGGGLAMAMHRSRFRHLLINENNTRACATLRRNRAVDFDPSAPLPSRLDDPWPLVEGSVSDVDFTKLNGTVDVVAGGVPCQPFSLGGAHRGHLDERNLWPELLRCVRETRPRVIVAENVKGLLRPSFDPYWQYILREIEAPFEERVAGEEWFDHDKRLMKAQRVNADPSERYDVHYKLVNAADYGVPQVRWRVFIVAFRKDLGIMWDFPEPTHSAAALYRAQSDGSYWNEHGLGDREPVFATTLGDPSAPRWRTVRDAIQGLPNPIEGRERAGYTHHVGWPGARVYPGHTPNHLDKPAKTVKAGVHGVPGGESVLLRDNGSIRYLTVREVARIMTFPDAWILDGPRGEQMRQLGNAVPVELAHAIVDTVATALRPARGQPARGRHAIARLGPRDPALTSAMMSKVRSKNTKAELALRRVLHAAGVRYRLHAKDVFGCPDLVNRTRRVAVFVDGDMWHGNPAEPGRRGRSSFAELFPTRTDWWVAKIERNKTRDQLVTTALTDAGYTVIRLWERDVLDDPAAAARPVLTALRGTA